MKKNINLFIILLLFTTNNFSLYSSEQNIDIKKNDYSDFLTLVPYTLFLLCVQFIIFPKIKKKKEEEIQRKIQETLNKQKKIKKVKKENQKKEVEKIINTQDFIDQLKENNEIKDKQGHSKKKFPESYTLIVNILENYFNTQTLTEENVDHLAKYLPATYYYYWKNPFIKELTKIFILLKIPFDQFHHVIESTIKDQHLYSPNMGYYSPECYINLPVDHGCNRTIFSTLLLYFDKDPKLCFELFEIMQDHVNLNSQYFYPCSFQPQIFTVQHEKISPLLLVIMQCLDPKVTDEDLHLLENIFNVIAEKNDYHPEEILNNTLLGVLLHSFNDDTNYRIEQITHLLLNYFKDKEIKHKLENNIYNLLQSPTEISKKSIYKITPKQDFILSSINNIFYDNIITDLQEILNAYYNNATEEIKNKVPYLIPTLIFYLDQNPHYTYKILKILLQINSDISKDYIANFTNLPLNVFLVLIIKSIKKVYCGPHLYKNKKTIFKCFNLLIDYLSEKNKNILYKRYLLDTYDNKNLYITSAQIFDSIIEFYISENITPDLCKIIEEIIQKMLLMNIDTLENLEKSLQSILDIYTSKPNILTDEFQNRFFKKLKTFNFYPDDPNQGLNTQLDLNYFFIEKYIKKVINNFLSTENNSENIDFLENICIHLSKKYISEINYTPSESPGTFKSNDEYKKNKKISFNSYLSDAMLELIKELKINSTTQDINKFIRIHNFLNAIFEKDENTSDRETRFCFFFGLTYIDFYLVSLIKLDNQEVLTSPNNNERFQLLLPSISKLFDCKINVDNICSNEDCICKTNTLQSFFTTFFENDTLFKTILENINPYYFNFLQYLQQNNILNNLQIFYLKYKRFLSINYLKYDQWKYETSKNKDERINSLETEMKQYQSDFFDLLFEYYDESLLEKIIKEKKELLFFEKNNPEKNILYRAIQNDFLECSKILIEKHFELFLNIDNENQFNLFSMLVNNINEKNSPKFKIFFALLNKCIQENHVDIWMNCIQQYSQYNSLDQFKQISILFDPINSN